MSLALSISGIKLSGYIYLHQVYLKCKAEPENFSPGPLKLMKFKYPFSRIHLYLSGFIWLHMHAFAFNCVDMHSSTLIWFDLHIFVFTCIHMNALVCINIHLNSSAFICIHLHSYAFILFYHHHHLSPFFMDLHSSVFSLIHQILSVRLEELRRSWIGDDEEIKKNEDEIRRRC